MKNNRRGFLKTSTAALGMAAATRARASARRPNVLLVLDDQERRSMHTPELSLANRDRLRPHAVEFQNAFCTYPLCSPSRATIMTGRWPHEVGILTNVDFAARNPSLPENVPNLARVFSGAGYKTVHFGKWHLSRRPHWIGNLFRYGFDSPHVSNQLLALGSDPRVTDNAANWIRRHGGRPPWLMVYSPINPHDICFPFLDSVYKPGDYPVALPPNFEPGMAPGIRTISGSNGIKQVEKTLPQDEAGWLAYLRLYCALIEDVDKNLGRVLDAVLESGQWDNTIIVFTSDHGEMGASHGLAHKGPTMYEENMRIPWWISDPSRITGFHQCGGLASNLDLVPTLCGLAGVPWPEPLAGLDLSGVVLDGHPIERDRVFGEGSPRKDMAWRGVRTREWKYWHYLNGEELLFNIVADPLEMNNLAGDIEAADVLARLREDVRAWRRETGDPIRDFLD